jgi:hypothetical protein
MMIPGLQRTTPWQKCPLHPESAVGKTTAREVAKAILVARVGSIPWEVNAQICTGTMRKPPPMPKRPQEKPTTRPVASNIIA